MSTAYLRHVVGETFGGAIRSAVAEQWDLEKRWLHRIWLKARRVIQSASDCSGRDLRHVAATNAIAAGADVQLDQLMLGRKDATETLRTYSHLWPNRVDEVIDAVERRRRAVLVLGRLRAV